MPIISATGQKIYSRHEQPPRHEKKKVDKGDKTNTRTSTTESSTANNIIDGGFELWPLLKECGYFLILIFLITYVVSTRKDGLISTTGSVMSNNEANIYTNLIKSTAQQIYLSDAIIPDIHSKIKDETEQHDNIIVQDDNQELLTERNPCGDVGRQVFEGGKVFVTYTLNTTSTNPPKTIIEAATPVQFIARNINDAIHTRSTLPLLHFMSVGMCKGQTKTIELTSERFNSTLHDLTPDQSFQPTMNQFLLTLFPTLTTTPPVTPTTTTTTTTTTTNTTVSKTSTPELPQSSLQLPLSLTMTISDVESKDSFVLQLQQEEKEKLRNGDFSAFLRAIFGSVHPLILLVAYIGLRFGSAYYKRMKIRAYREKKRAEALQQGATPTEAADLVENEPLTYNDVINDQVNQEVEKALKEQEQEQLKTKKD